MSARTFTVIMDWTNGGREAVAFVGTARDADDAFGKAVAAGQSFYAHVLNEELFADATYGVVTLTGDVSGQLVVPHTVIHWDGELFVPGEE